MTVSRADRATKSVTCVVFLLSFVAAIASAQGEARTIILAGPSACSECRVALTELFRIGGDSRGDVFRNVSIAADSRGRIAIAPTADRAAVLVFSPDGKTSRQIGRRGDGPGEFRFPMRVIFGPDDWLYVYDDFTRRVSTFDRDLEFVRSATFPVPVEDWLIGPAGDFVVHGNLRTRDRIGIPFHLVRPTGEIIGDGFGGTGGATLPNQDPGIFVRNMVRGGPSHFWTSYLNRYELEQWDFRGRLQLRVIGRHPWFESWSERPRERLDAVKPVPTMVGISADGPLRVWTYSLVPRIDWKPASVGTRRGERAREPGVLSRTEMERYVDTVIELIDVSQARILGSTRLPGYILPINGTASLAAKHTETAEGADQIVVLHLRLVQPPGRRQ